MVPVHYVRLLRYATLYLRAEDVLTFLGRKLHGGFTGEIPNEWKRRWPGARLKDWTKGNWIKMYDKHGCVLQVENPATAPDRTLFAAVLRGEHTLQGFRNRELCTQLFGSHRCRRSPAKRAGLTPRQTAPPAWPRRKESPLPPLANHPPRPRRPERGYPAARGGVPHRLPHGRRVTREGSPYAAENLDRKTLRTTTG